MTALVRLVTMIAGLFVSQPPKVDFTISRVAPALTDSIQLKIQFGGIASTSDSVKVQAGYNSAPLNQVTHYLPITATSDVLSILAQSTNNSGWICVSQHKPIGGWGENACKSWSYTFPPLSIARLKVLPDSSVTLAVGNTLQLCAFVVFNDGNVAPIKDQIGLPSCVEGILTFPDSVKHVTARERAVMDTLKVTWISSDTTVATVTNNPLVSPKILPPTTGTAGNP